MVNILNAKKYPTLPSGEELDVSLDLDHWLLNLSLGLLPPAVLEGVGGMGP